MSGKLSFWESLVSEIVVRLIYFVGAAVGIPLITSAGIAMTTRRAYETGAVLYQKTVLSQFPFSPYWLGVTITAIVAAFIGPMIFAQDEELGRGALGAIKRAEGRRD